MFIIFQIATYALFGLYSGVIFLYLVKPVMRILSSSYKRNEMARDEMHRVFLLMWMVMYAIAINVTLSGEFKRKMEQGHSHSM